MLISGNHWLLQPFIIRSTSLGLAGEADPYLTSSWCMRMALDLVQGGAPLLACHDPLVP